VDGIEVVHAPGEGDDTSAAIAEAHRGFRPAGHSPLADRAAPPGVATSTPTKVGGRAHRRSNHLSHPNGDPLRRSGRIGMVTIA
jgi:hypothetical protein